MITLWLKLPEAAYFQFKRNCRAWTAAHAATPNRVKYQSHISATIPHTTLPFGQKMFDKVPEAIEAFKNGEFLVVMDDESRENEGDLIIAASETTTEKMAFLVKHSSGYVCAPLTNELADKYKLPMMVPELEDLHKTAYTVTCDAKQGTTTGISAHDRALTVRKLADPSSDALTFNRPGHMLPLRARDGGVLKRRGHTEAAVDLCKLAGKPPVAVICEVVRPEDGLMARRDDCIKFAREHNIKIISIDSLVAYLESKST